MSLLSVSLLGIDPTVHAYAQGQLSNQFPQSIVAFSNTDTTPHALELKSIQQGDSEPQEERTKTLFINSLFLALTFSLYTLPAGLALSCIPQHSQNILSVIK